MGRLDHLNRLGLGLSAFRALQVQAPLRDDHASDADPDMRSTSQTPQQYDAKGRPKNPLADRHNTAQRYAQNEVLELVNIVERKQESKHRGEREVRMHESISHAQLDIYADGVSLLLNWYPQTLLQRILLGIDGSETSFARILAKDAAKVPSGSFAAGFDVLFPGFLLYITNATLSVLAYDAIDRTATAVASSFDPIMRPHAVDSIRMAANTVKVAAKLCLLPWLHLALIARLGLVQPRGIISTTTMLIGFHHLRHTRLEHADRAATSLMTLALPLLMIITGNDTSMFMHRWSHFHCHRPVAVSQASSIEQIVGQIFRHVRRQSLGWSNSISRQPSSHNNSTLKTVTSRVTDNDQARRAVILWHVPRMCATILRWLVRLSLDLVVVQISARTFDMIIGPIMSSGASARFPMNDTTTTTLLFEARSGMDITAILNSLSQIGLALGLKLTVETVVRVTIRAYEAFQHTGRNRQRKQLGRGLNKVADALHE